MEWIMKKIIFILSIFIFTAKISFADSRSLEQKCADFLYLAIKKTQDIKDILNYKKYSGSKSYLNNIKKAIDDSNLKDNLKTYIDDLIKFNVKSPGVCVNIGENFIFKPLDEIIRAAELRGPVLEMKDPITNENIYYLKRFGENSFPI